MPDFPAMRWLLFMMLIPLVGHGAGFLGGNFFRAVEIEGRISVSCQNPSTGKMDFVSTICEEEILEPNEVARFSAEKAIDADTVELTVADENGTLRAQKIEYDSALGRSEEPVNLWIRTFLQRPLLSTGKNKVIYKLRKNGSTVQTGEFVAEVASSEKRRCGAEYVFYSSNLHDCQVPKLKCGQYFARYNYCQ